MRLAVLLLALAGSAAAKDDFVVLEHPESGKKSPGDLHCVRIEGAAGPERFLDCRPAGGFDYLASRPELGAFPAYYRRAGERIAGELLELENGGRALDEKQKRRKADLTAAVPLVLRHVRGETLVVPAEDDGVESVADLICDVSPSAGDAVICEPRAGDGFFDGRSREVVDAYYRRFAGIVETRLAAERDPVVQKRLSAVRAFVLRRLGPSLDAHIATMRNEIEKQQAIYDKWVAQRKKESGEIWKGNTDLNVANGKARWEAKDPLGAMFEFIRPRGDGGYVRTTPSAAELDGWKKALKSARQGLAAVETRKRQQEAEEQSAIEGYKDHYKKSHPQAALAKDLAATKTAAAARAARAEAGALDVDLKDKAGAYGQVLRDTKRGTAQAADTIGRVASAALASLDSKKRPAAAPAARRAPPREAPKTPPVSMWRELGSAVFDGKAYERLAARRSKELAAYFTAEYLSVSWSLDRARVVHDSGTLNERDKARMRRLIDRLAYAKLRAKANFDALRKIDGVLLPAVFGEYFAAAHEKAEGAKRSAVPAPLVVRYLEAAPPVVVEPVAPPPASRNDEELVRRLSASDAERKCRDSLKTRVFNMSAVPDENALEQRRRAQDVFDDCMASRLAGKTPVAEYIGAFDVDGESLEPATREPAGKPAETLAKKPAPRPGRKASGPRTEINPLGAPPDWPR